MYIETQVVMIYSYIDFCIIDLKVAELIDVEKQASSHSLRILKLNQHLFDCFKLKKVSIMVNKACTYINSLSIFRAA